MIKPSKLTDDDRALIAKLKGIREYHQQQVNNLKDAEIAKKFDVSKSLIKLIPAIRDPIK